MEDYIISISQELPIGAVIIGAPGSEAPLAIKLVGEIDIGTAIEQVAKVNSCALEMDGVDLEVSPIEGAIRIVMEDLAGAFGVFGSLDGQRNSAVGPEFGASVLLVGGQMMPELVGLGFDGVFRAGPGSDDDGPANMHYHGRLEAKRVVGPEEQNSRYE